jgi:HAE1 family hydrophobic/amphiphilic exporter-1
MDREQAILEANRARLRPILMTTMMLVASMIPIAVGKGPGSAGRAAMAKVIIGGQMLCLLLTLLVTPVSYSIFDDWGRGRFWGRRKRTAKTGTAEPAYSPTAT